MPLTASFVLSGFQTSCKNVSVFWMKNNIFINGKAVILAKKIL